jgi:hypothetical protein
LRYDIFFAIRFFFSYLIHIHLVSVCRYAALARLVTAYDAASFRLELAASVINRMRIFTSLCNSVHAIATNELLQLLQLRRLPPSFISHSMQRLDPTECGFINTNAACDFLCACSIVRADSDRNNISRISLVERSRYIIWLQSIQVKFHWDSRAHSVYDDTGVA